MTSLRAGRKLGSLTFQEVGSSLRSSSILCMPMGSMEQHGPHLPLDTDTVLAEALTERFIDRWGETYDLWQLPSLNLGLSREHAWASGTLSLSVAGITAVLRDLGREIARALPARNLLIVNGHGGNRGILEALGRELRADFGLNVGALHLGALMGAAANAPPDIHAGRDETSVMLALVPDLVRRERLAELKPPANSAAVQRLVLDAAASWPWSSDDKRIAEHGVIGDARAASAELGATIVERVVSEVEGAFRQLLDNAATQA